MEHEPTTVNVWAPELFYDDEKDRYMIVLASTIPHRFPKGQEAEDNNHRMYYTTTRDFETFSETKLFLDPGFSVIDATIVKRDKDDYVLVLKDNTRPERNLSVAFSDDPLGPYENYSKPFTKKFTEGPTVIEKQNSWLIYYDAYDDKEYRAVETEGFKSFEGISKDIQIPEGHKHGTIVKASESVLEQLKKKARKLQSQENYIIKYSNRMMNKSVTIIFCFLWCVSASGQAPDTARSHGTTLPNMDYHHGQLSPVMGVHNIQILRANREFPDRAEGTGWTYNHAPNMAYWNGTYYVQYL